MFTLTQLEYIIAVDTHRHFATAAEHCFVSQPTLSMQIKKMEDLLDVVIFDRSKHPVIPTDIGIKIIDQARVIIRENKKVKEIIKSHKNEVGGELKIGIIPTLASSILPRFVGDFVRNFENVELQVQEMITSDIEIALENDQIDVGILVTPLKKENLNEMPMFYEEILIYGNKNNPLMQKEKVNPLDVGEPDIWLLNNGHCFRSQVINLCAVKNIKTQVLPFHYESGSLETLIKLVDKEGGATLLPELVVEDLLNNRKECVRAFEDFTPLREISLVTARNFAKSKLVELLFDEIRKSVPQYMLSSDRGHVVEWK